MKGLTLFLFLSLTCPFVLSATADDYLETIPLTGNQCVGSLAVLKSGDIITAGVDFTSNDILLIKLSASGTVLKVQRISGIAADEAQAVVATSDGGAVVVGNTGSFGAGNLDGFVLKVRPSGTIAWKRVFGTSGNEHFVKIVQTADKGFIVLGDADHDPNLNDIVLVKFNRNGLPIWRKVLTAAGFDHASDLALTSGNGAIVAIASDFADGVRSILVKVRSNGVVEWSRMYGSSGSHVAFSVFQTRDGGYYFTEIFTPSGSQRTDTVLSKLNSTGIPVWSRVYRSPGVRLSASVSTIEANESLLLAGNITASGGSNSRGILVGLNENGSILWRKKVKPDSKPVFIGRALALPGDGSILVSGCTGIRTSNNMDSVILKTKANGTIPGGCSKLTNFPLSSQGFSLSSTEFVLNEIPVPFFTGSAGFQITTLAVNESVVCSGE